MQATPSFNIGYFYQVARASAEAPDGVSVFDMSDDGLEPDVNGNGRADDLGEDDVNVVAFDEKPALGLSLHTTRVTGDLSGFSIFYDLNIKNLGDVPLSSIQILEDFASAFERHHIFCC